MNEAEREELRVECARVSDPFGTVTVNARQLRALLDLDMLGPLLMALPPGDRPPRRSKP